VAKLTNNYWNSGSKSEVNKHLLLRVKWYTQPEFLAICCICLICPWSKAATDNTEMHEFVFASLKCHLWKEFVHSWSKSSRTLKHVIWVLLFSGFWVKGSLWQTLYYFPLELSLNSWLVIILWLPVFQSILYEPPNSVPLFEFSQTFTKPLALSQSPMLGIKWKSACLTSVKFWVQTPVLSLQKV
jgi:hypothetical protein